MNFEHLIPVNDPPDARPDPQSDAQPLTRAQLWAGLVLRAERPELFVPGLERCTILARTGNMFERELHYGQAIVRDRVTLTPGQCVRYDIPATAAHVGGSLTMTIEAGDAQPLCVRFAYQTTLPETNDANGEEARQTAEIVKSAYREADFDTVRLIRRFVPGGSESCEPGRPGTLR